MADVLGCVMDVFSGIDGKPALVAVSTDSGNVKTGRVGQVWYLDAIFQPHIARKEGKAETTCGDCPHKESGCYVVACNAPRAVFDAIKRGRYLKVGSIMAVKAFLDAAGVEEVRDGAFGDPAVLNPTMRAGFVNAIVDRMVGNYTHQWRRRVDLRETTMASCDSRADRILAKAHGWRTFRIVARGDDRLMAGEVWCPAQRSDGKVTCKVCRMCTGLLAAGRPDVAVHAHGACAAAAERFAVKEL